MTLSTTQLDRALGCVMASALGDALGAPYEFKAALTSRKRPRLKATAQWELGEWTDDTTMATAILSPLTSPTASALHTDARYSHYLDLIVEGWLKWFRSGPKDIGRQTRSVFGGIHTRTTQNSARTLAARCHHAAQDHHTQNGRSAGNGSLMRSSAVVLAALTPDVLALYPTHRSHQMFADFPQAYLDAVSTLVADVSTLTHIESDATEACTLFTLAAIDAILGDGTISMDGPLSTLPHNRATVWRQRLHTAESMAPWEVIESNYWVVGAAMCAWSAVRGSTNLNDALVLAVQAGEDTDTVAAITGILAGASYGYSTAPGAALRHLHGYPTMTGQDLLNSALLALTSDQPLQQWPRARRMPCEAEPFLAEHPRDPNVLVGNLAALDTLPAHVDAVVSLCRVGTEQLPATPNREHFKLWLIDKPGANLDPLLALTQGADLISQLRSEGKVVFVHCFEGRSRTPSVTAAYSITRYGMPAQHALEELRTALPLSDPGDYFVDALGLLELGGAVPQT